MSQPIYLQSPFDDFNKWLFQQLAQKQQNEVHKEQLANQKKQLDLDAQKYQLQKTKEANERNDQMAPVFRALLGAAHDPNPQIQQMAQPVMQDLGNANVPSGQVESQALAVAGPQVMGNKAGPSQIEQVRMKVAKQQKFAETISHIDGMKTLPPNVREAMKDRVVLVNDLDEQGYDASVITQVAGTESEIVALDKARQEIKNTTDKNAANAAAMKVLKNKYPDTFGTMPDTGWDKAADTLANLLEREKQARLAIWEATERQKIGAKPTMANALEFFGKVLTARINDHVPPSPDGSIDSLLGGDKEQVGLNAAYNETKELMRQMGYFDGVPGLEAYLDRGEKAQRDREKAYSQSASFNAWLRTNESQPYAKKKEMLVRAGFSNESAMRLLGQKAAGEVGGF